MNTELPHNWKLTTIGICCITASGGTPNRKKPEYYGGEIPWLKSGELSDGYIFQSEEFITKLGLKNSSSKVFDKDTILIALYGATVGKLGILGITSATNQAICSIKPKDGFNRKFLFWFLRYKRNELLNKRIGGAQPNISQQILRDLDLPVPPTNEQNRIVIKIEELLTRLDAGIKSLKKVQILLKKYRQSVLKSAVEGKLTSEWRKLNKDELEHGDKLLERILKERKEKWEAEQLANYKAKGIKPPKDWKDKYKEPSPPDTSKLPELPDGWVWCKLGQVTHLITKGSSPRWQGFEYVDKGIMFIRSQNVGWGELDISDVAFLSKGFNKKEKKSVLKKGDVLLNIVGASIGRSAIVTDEIENANINQAVALIRLIKDSILNTYLRNYLISADAQSRIHSKAVDVARANFSLADISDLCVPIPPYKEQIKISEEIERLSSIIEKTEFIVLSELKRSQSHKQSILKHAFEGKLVPQNPNDEPASVLLERIKAEKTKLKN